MKIVALLSKKRPETTKPLHKHPKCYTNQHMVDSSIRLNKHLALQLGVSRREADELILDGRVLVDGERAVIGARISIDSDVAVDGKAVSHTTAKRYVAFHKPVGYVCSRKAQDENPTIYDLLPPELHPLKTVGRLDKDSSGLLLLSNDGDFTLRMTHPRFYKMKKYEVSLERDLEPLHQQMIADYGVQLADGPSKLGLERLHDDSRRDWLVTMGEGRNRQIRRTFAALGYTVTKLHRTQFGPYQLIGLEEGKTEDVKPLE